MSRPAPAGPAALGSFPAVCAALLLTVAVVLGALLGAGPAAADPASGYRYWSFWERDGSTWTYATQGAATTRPADGSVQGFRFSVSRDSQDAAKPRGEARFEAVCAKTPAKEGSKRIALVLDFGTPADAPGGETPPAQRSVCAQVGEDATSAEALAAVAKPLRYDSSALLCAIAGYPGSGCADPVSGSASQAAEPTAPAPPTSPSVSASDDGGEGPSAGVLVGLAAVLALGAAAVWQARRRRG
ncbi:SCO2322 family protein [Streptomyces sp. NPDC058657]|uniref:SCO2322 family protein n=1 Tax=unclassified Streptomyces TaxID=2593676 RepID=UPI00365BF551